MVKYLIQGIYFKMPFMWITITAKYFHHPGFHTESMQDKVVSWLPRF